MPRFTFFTSHSREPVTAASQIWQEPIPLRLDALLKNEGESVCHAHYFQAAQSFLENNSYEMIVRAVSRRLDRDVTAADIQEIRICLQKHGEFYHPARIEILVFQKQFSLVLNVAISETGRRFIEKEYQHLRRLTMELRYHHLPQVYGFGRIPGANGLNFAMFLGDWFDGYHEFHLSIIRISKNQKLVDMYDQLNSHLQVFRFRMAAEFEKRLPSTDKGHKEIVEALKKHNVKEGENTIKKHILENRDVFLSGIPLIATNRS